MNKLREFLIRLALPKDVAVLGVPVAAVHDDEQYGREYVEYPDGLRLYFEDGEYVGFSTKMPYIGSDEANKDNT